MQTILLVDDVKENIDILVEFLKEYDLITAVDGKIALEVANSEDIDLILLDIMMPVMDGFEVCNILKANDKTSHIPIIFLSALDKQEDLQHGFELGAVDYITKPFNPKELMSRVDTHLKLRAYEKNLEDRVEQEVLKNRIKQDIIHQKSKEAALGELLMHIAHQWKQPLASLSALNISQKIKIEQDLPITQKDNLERIEKSQNLINFMSNTVETFRNFYLPSYASGTFLFNDCVKRVLDISDATIKHNKIDISISSNETEETFGNENEFTQIVFSLINNARDIFKQREIENPQIKIDIQNHILTISDNGGGIKSEIIDDIFLPFKSTTNSSGIGLYISKEIAQKNGGKISVSNDERGAVFRVEFLDSDS